MKDSYLESIIRLIKKTGDRCVVVNPVDNSSYVVMNLEEYEKLVLGKSEVRGLTEDELLDKINRDIAIWRASQEGENLANSRECFSDVEETPKNDVKENKQEDERKEEDRYYFEPVE